MDPACSPFISQLHDSYLILLLDTLNDDSAFNRGVGRVASVKERGVNIESSNGSRGSQLNDGSVVRVLVVSPVELSVAPVRR